MIIYTNPNINPKMNGLYPSEKLEMGINFSFFMKMEKMILNLKYIIGHMNIQTLMVD